MVKRILAMVLVMVLVLNIGGSVPVYAAVMPAASVMADGTDDLNTDSGQGAAAALPTIVPDDSELEDVLGENPGPSSTFAPTPMPPTEDEPIENPTAVPSVEDIPAEENTDAVVDDTDDLVEEANPVMVQESSDGAAAETDSGEADEEVYSGKAGR